LHKLHLTRLKNYQCNSKHTNNWMSWTIQTQYFPTPLDWYLKLKCSEVMRLIENFRTLLI
jgi:hypothetical protein